MSVPTTLGIDPGLTGALCLLNGAAIDVFDVPTLQIGKKSHVDVYALARLIDQLSTSNPTVFLEQVGTRPGEGAVGAFSFGHTCGLLRGICAAHFLKIEMVTPATWKRAMKVTGDKDECRAKAAAMWPRHSGLFARKKDDGRAEAALLAVYGRRQIYAEAA